MSTIQIATSSMTVGDAVDSVRAYRIQTGRTVEKYDLPRCSPGPVTTEEIKRTRSYPLPHQQQGGRLVHPQEQRDRLSRARPSCGPGRR